MYKICGTILLLSISFAAEEVTFDNYWGTNPLFNVVSETHTGVEIIFSMHKMIIEEIIIDGRPQNVFGVPGIFLPNNESAPNLAGTGRYIAIPQDAKAKLTILDTRTEIYHDIEVAPAPRIPLDSDDSPLEYKKDMTIYNRNEYYPKTPVQVSNVMKMRGVDVVILGITPFQYNPVTKELVVYKDIRVRVDFIGGHSHFGDDRLRSRFWEPMLQAHLLNYSSLPKIDYYESQRFNARDGYEYIIIVPDDPIFEAWGDTIKAWRKLQGISCEVFTLTEVGGSSASDIENFLNNAYNTWDPAPVAFLLLSDHPTEERSYGITSPVYDLYCVSDNIYADVNGDNLPDMHHGRICAQTEDHLSTMVNKFLSYERNPYTATNFYDEPLCACGWQTERWFQLCSEVIRGFFINGLSKNPAREYNIYDGSPTVGCDWSTATNTATVVDYFYNLGWLTSTTNPYDETWWDNGSANGISGSINSGAFIVQHRDHGSLYGWAKPNYKTEDLYHLTNDMFPFVFSINCLTGKYDHSSETFTERFHRAEHGALGANAATEGSYSFVNDTYVWGMYDCMWQQFMPDYPGSRMTGHDDLRPCMAMTYGKFFLESSSWPYNPDMKPVTYHLFHHHGDCFTTLFSETPQALTVSHASTLTDDQTYFTVSADDSSIIALTVNGEIIGVAEGTGNPVDIPISPQPLWSIMKVTVTKANYYRYEEDVPVISSSYPYVIKGKDIIDDGGGDGLINPGESIDYGVWAKNIGTGTAQDVYGLLSESDPYVTVTEDSSWYGDISDDDSVLSNPYYTFAVAGNCRNSHMIEFTLEFHDINDSIFTSYRSLTVYAPELAFVDVNVENDDNSNGILDPGETGDLVVVIENEGDASADNITSTLMTSSPYITINDNSGDFGSLNPGETSDNSADPYNITAGSATPLGALVHFQVEVVSGAYRDTLVFSIAVGPKHYFLWNPDPSPESGMTMNTILSDLGYSGDFSRYLAPDLSLYQTVLVCCGISTESGGHYVIEDGSPEAEALEDFLENQHGRMYLEGMYVWAEDPTHNNGYNFCPLFGLNAMKLDSLRLGPIAGVDATFTQDMNFDHEDSLTFVILNPTGTGSLIFYDTDEYFNCGVANEPGTYKTVGISFESGYLIDGTPPSTRAVLLDSIMKFFDAVLPDTAPPSSPCIAQVEKSSSHVKLTWNKITTDTLGNAESMDYYVVYRNTTPYFIPSSSDSIGAVAHPDTSYTDTDALNSSESYYYLVIAVDSAKNKSKKSNMAYRLDKFVNYNTDRSSRNWVSLPWHSGYSTVSDLVADLSPAGDPLESVTNLRDDMVEETWLWDTDFMMWSGPNDFTIDPGRGYEMVAIKDTNLVLVGFNDPDGLISLNHNTDRSSRNWVSIPYNAAYSTVDDIVQEYSPAGDPLESITNLRDDMIQETWLYDTDFMMWYGPNDFAIEPGRGYEFVPVKDTTWNPNEYSNEAFVQMLASRGVKRSDVEVYEGQSLEPDRAPKWIVKELDKRIDYSDAKNYKLNTRRLDEKADYREPGISHILRVHLDVKEFDNLVFTAYRSEQPYDVLTENMIGSCVARRGDQAAFFFNVGNFKQPWQDGEEVIVIIEALRQGRSYFTVLNVILDKGVDIQDADNITLMPIPEPIIAKGLISWHGVDNDNVVGYSLYESNKRLNERVLKRSCYSAKRDVNIRPVIRGGYETVYSSQGHQSTLNTHISASYAFNLFPNPFITLTRIEYAVPKKTIVEIVIYDVSGRQVKTLVNKMHMPGYYSTLWNGMDDKGRTVSSGIYFIKFAAGNVGKADVFKAQDKILLVK